MTHILHITPYYAPAYAFGGVVRSVEGMAQALAQRGHTMTILTTDALTLASRYQGEAYPQHDNIQVMRVPNALYALRRFNLSTPFAWRDALRDILPQIDIVHLHEFRTVENMLTVPLAHRHDVPLVLSPHGTMTRATGRSTLKSAWDRLLSPQIAPHIDHVIALAQPELDDIRHVWRWGHPDYSVIPNGTNPDEFTNLPDDTAFREKYRIQSARVVLFMGRLHTRKGVDVLVRAFKQASLSDTSLVLAGPDEGMRETLLPLLDDTIVLTGYLDGDERLAALASADLFALPAVGEGLSMAVLEAMGAGIPVLLSPGCNLPEAENAGAGRIAEPQVDPLANALHDLLSDDEHLIQMGVNARRLVHDKFTWARVATQLEAIYARYLA